jgi:hypothetical protein
MPSLGPAYRICTALSLAHAILVTGGLLLVWAIRSFASHATFAAGLEPAWFWSLLLWPVWWPACLVTRWAAARRSLKTLLVATAIWLVAAVPSALLVWSLRGFR